MSVITHMPISVRPTPASSPPDGEQHLLLHDVRWEDYRVIGEILSDRPALRLTYDRGALELMTTSRKHEKYKHWLGRFLETIAEEANLPIEPGGNMTFQRADLARGLEGDQCYWIAHEPQVRGKLTWDPESDPPPDLALEIEISRSALDRLSIYAALKVPEVWCFDGQTLRVYLLQADGTYQQAENSLASPMIPPSEIIPFLHRCESEDYLSVVRAFRLWVREQLARYHPE